MDGVILADFYASHLKSEGSAPFDKRWLLKVGSDKFNLPDETLKQLRDNTQRDVEWVDAEFGIKLVEKSVQAQFRSSLSK